MWASNSPGSVQIQPVHTFTRNICRESYCCDFIYDEPQKRLIWRILKRIVDIKSCQYDVFSFLVIYDISILKCLALSNQHQLKYSFYCVLRKLGIFIFGRFSKSLQGKHLNSIKKSVHKTIMKIIVRSHKERRIVCIKSWQSSVFVTISCLHTAVWHKFDVVGNWCIIDYHKSPTVCSKTLLLHILRKGQIHKAEKNPHLHLMLFTAVAQKL